MFFIIVTLKNFAIFTGKYLIWIFFLIKLHALVTNLVIFCGRHKCMITLPNIPKLLPARAVSSILSIEAEKITSWTENSESSS